MYKGIGIVNLPSMSLMFFRIGKCGDSQLPRGPSTSSVRGGATRRTMFRLEEGGSRKRRFTSGGRDIGALPTRLAHFVALEKDRKDEVLAKAGSRKSGNDTVEELNFLARIGDSMMI